MKPKTAVVKPISGRKAPSERRRPEPKHVNLEDAPALSKNAGTADAQSEQARSPITTKSVKERFSKISRDEDKTIPSIDMGPTDLEPQKAIPRRNISRPRTFIASEQQQFLEQLATSPTPTVLYTLPPQRRFIFTAYLSSANTAAIGVYTLGNYASLVNAPLYMTYAGWLFGGIWFTIGAWAGFAPYKMISKITALPASAEDQATKTGLRPTLQFQPLQLLPFLRPQTFEVRLQDVVCDKPIGQAIARHETARRAADLQTGWMASAMRPFSTFVNDVTRTFGRRSLAYVRVTDVPGWAGNWKLDCQNVDALEQGKALERLIRVDEEPIDWTSRMIK